MLSVLRIYNEINSTVVHAMKVKSSFFSPVSNGNSSPPAKVAITRMAKVSFNLPKRRLQPGRVSFSCYDQLNYTLIARTNIQLRVHLRGEAREIRVNILLIDYWTDQNRRG